MGAYRFSIVFSLQVGLAIKYQNPFITLELPFVSFNLAIKRYASGFYIGL